jgi:hypothetical protein
MARTTLTPKVLVAYPTLPVAANSLDLAFETGTATDGFAAPIRGGGKDLLLVTNVNASAQTFTLVSVIDDLKRTGDITTYSLAQNEIAAVSLQSKGFDQGDGMVHVNVGHNDIHATVIHLP